MKFRNLNEASTSKVKIPKDSIAKYLVSKFESYDDLVYYVNNEISPSFWPVTPENKYELKDIIKETIEREGSDCDLNFIDTSLITDMSDLFSGMRGFNGHIENWDVSNVINMRSMFYGAESFNRPLNNWDVSKVQSMERMFFRAESFNQPLNNWDTSSVVRMDCMFQGAKMLHKNNKIPSWYKE